MERMFELLSKFDVKPTGNKVKDYETIRSLNELAHTCRENGWNESAERFEASYLELMRHYE